MATGAPGRYLVGAVDGGLYPADGEGPQREVLLSAWKVDKTTVTVQSFDKFVRETGHRTTAELLGWSLVFYAQVHPEASPYVRRDAAVVMAPWWVPISGADWRQPDGPGSDAFDRPDHPVVHVSWWDAVAYSEWTGKRLPTEAEWEVSARGGLEGTTYPWGDTLDSRRCNVWQGDFPHHNTGEDGYLGTAPARSFDPNGWGLYNTVGNVWEWCSDNWSANWHQASKPETRINPRGPKSGQGRVIRGGSYLCHPSNCHRFRLSARSFNYPDATTSHMGFRCARDFQTYPYPMELTDV